MARTAKFCVFQDAAGGWRTHLKAGNGEIVFQGESHPTKQKALRAAETMKRLASGACIVVEGEPARAPSVKVAAKKKAKPAAAPSVKRATRRPDASPMSK